MPSESLPAVQLVFSTERARHAFLFYLSRVQTGAVVNPSLAVVLGQLAEPPRELEVQGKPDA